MLRTSGTEMRGGGAVVGGGGGLGEIVGDDGGLGEMLGDGGGLGEMVGDVTTRVAWTPRLPPPHRPVIEYVPGRTPDRIVACVLNLPLPSAVVSTSWLARLDSRLVRTYTDMKDDDRSPVFDLRNA